MSLEISWCSRELVRTQTWKPHLWHGAIGSAQLIFRRGVKIAKYEPFMCFAASRSPGFSQTGISEPFRAVLNRYWPEICYLGTILRSCTCITAKDFSSAVHLQSSTDGSSSYLELTCCEPSMIRMRAQLIMAGDCSCSYQLGEKRHGGISNE